MRILSLLSLALLAACSSGSSGPSASGPGSSASDGGVVGEPADGSVAQAGPDAGTLPDGGVPPGDDAGEPGRDAGQPGLDAGTPGADAGPTVTGWKYDAAPGTFLQTWRQADPAGNLYWLECPNYSATTPAAMSCELVSVSGATGVVRFRTKVPTAGDTVPYGGGTTMTASVWVLAWNGHVSAYSTADGRQLWDSPVDSAFGGSMALGARDVLYVQGRSTGDSHDVHGLSLLTGKPLWTTTVTLAGEGAALFPTTDGSVLVTGLTFGGHSMMPNETALLDDAGRILNPNVGIVGKPRAVIAGTLLTDVPVPQVGMHLRGYDATTFAPRFDTDDGYGFPIGATVVISGHHSPTDGAISVVALDPVSGAVRWSLPDEGPTALTANGTVVVAEAANGVLVGSVEVRESDGAVVARHPLLRSDILIGGLAVEFKADPGANFGWPHVTATPSDLPGLATSGWVVMGGNLMRNNLPAK